MNLTKYAALDVKITDYTKINSQFSFGRARVFYIGPNPNRTIFDESVAKDLIKTIPGTPIVGRFNANKDDFEGHGEGQTAFGFVPLDSNPLKVEITEDIYGLPVKKIYYEVDVVIWDGRFPEAKKILDEEKSLSMELNPETLDGEIEMYDDNHYLKVTNAEFYGITVLGDEHTPCFKDAKFLQSYSRMLNAYEMVEQESNIGGKDMPNKEEALEVVEVVETDATITNEEATTEEVTVEETVIEKVEEKNDAPTEDITEEGTEESEETTYEEVNEEDTETLDETDEEVEVTEETIEETVEDSEVENYEINLDNLTAMQKHELLGYAIQESLGEDGYVRDYDDVYVYVNIWEEGMFRFNYSKVEGKFVIDMSTKQQVVDGGYIEFSEGADYKVSEIIENLDNENTSLKEKLEIYENNAKEELVNKFSSKINDSEFLSGVKDTLSDYTVEDLKTTLGNKLAEQILEEETTEDEKVTGMVFSFNGVAKKETNSGWQNLVRASKESSANK